MMKYALFSDQGDRVINEDSIGHGSAVDRECFAVCDGLGGHSKGEIASRPAQTAVEQFRQRASVKAGIQTIQKRSSWKVRRQSSRIRKKTETGLI